jgi:thioredoxin-like negative regulator of GroEL
MTKIYAVVVAVFLLTFNHAAQTEQIVWEKDFKKAQQSARESGRPLLLDFTAAWCKPCKAMDAEFWVLEDVVKAVKPFIAVKVDFDKEKSLVGRYNVSAIPFVVFADPLGNTVTFRRGFGTKSVSEINQIFDEMPKDFSTLKKAYDAIELKKSDGLALLEIADFYRASKCFRSATNFIDGRRKPKRFKTTPKKKSVSPLLSD